MPKNATQRFERTIAIGDIHGCCKALRGLIEAIAPTSDDLLIFLGDYVDRGPDSRGVIEYLMELEASCHAVFLRGNHEIAFESVLNHALDPNLWFQSGGLATLVSYGGTLDRIPYRHREFLARNVRYFENERHFFVHANYLADVVLADQPDRVLFWEHLHDRLPQPHISGKTAWLGHSPQFQGEVLDLGHAKCIDTFCFGGKYLTAVEVDTGEQWQTNLEGHVRCQGSALGRSLKRWLRACHQSLRAR